MHENARRLDVLDTMVTEAVRWGIGHRTAEDARLAGRTLRLGGRDLVNFTSCSYLGLELDERLKQGAIEATERYGTQFSSSRVYVSAPPYRELEEMLGRIFEAEVVAAPSTTLGHLAAIPTLVDDADAVVLDHQVHHSVQMACVQLRVFGVPVELVRHSRLDLLEERLNELRQHHRHVWYMADGVYSMYGDFAPLTELVALLDRHPQLRLYVDDAHGMSWRGRHGRGVALDQVPLHPRMVLATSLNKAFAAAGGALVFADPEEQRRVRVCGGPLLFSGPIQPPMLGAALASARIHLSDEIHALQRRLRRNAEICDEALEGMRLPVLSEKGSPIRFVGLGMTHAAQRMTARLMEEGFYANVGQFPAAPIKRSGVRFTLTLHQSEDDVRALVEAIDRNAEDVLSAEGQSLDDVWRAFRLTRPPGVRTRAEGRRGPRPLARPSSGLRLERASSIEKLSAEEWDRCLGRRGTFTWEGMHFLERCFRRGGDPANDWGFHYYRVVDADDRTRLLTFFTDAIWKADMLAAPSVSEKIERRRREDPYFLASRALGMGALLTEGDHLYLDPEGRAAGSQEWKAWMALLLEAVGAEAEAADLETVVLRDLAADDPEMDSLLLEHGFVKLPAPDTAVAEIDWQSEEELLGGLDRRARRHHRAEVLPWNEAYSLEVIGAGTRRPDSAELAHYHALYRNVKGRSLTLNTYSLPEDLFAQMLELPSWELLVLRPRGELRERYGDDPVSVTACFRGPDQYAPMVIGLDYRHVRAHGLYRQSLRRVLLRARELGLRRVLLGMGAMREKKRFGARAEARCLYVQSDDLYAADVVAQMGVEKAE